MLELKVAQRKKAKLKLGMAAPSGGGKTLGALLIAYGLLKEDHPELSDAQIWAKIAVIDSENGSGQLYVGTEPKGSNIKIGQYNTVTLQPPFEADKYSEAIQLCFDSEMEVCIIDSTTHLWAGQGGLLEQQGNVAKRTGNSYTAWRDVTPQHTRFIDKMLQTDVHIIATMRSKTDYVQEKNDQGKTTIRKVGLAPVQKDGMEYEFTAFLDIDAEHTAFGSKDRTGIVDQQYFTITPETGKKFMKWLNSGTESSDVVISTKSYNEGVKENSDKTDELKKKIITLCTELKITKNEELMTLIKSYEKSGNPNKIKDLGQLAELHTKLVELKGDK